MARLTPASGLWHLAVTRLMPASSLWHLAVTWLMPASDLWHLTVTRLTPVSDLWHQTVPCLTSGVLFSLFVEMSWLMVRHSALCVPRRRASTRRSWRRVTLSASCGRRSKPTPPSSSPRGRQNHRQSLTPVPAPGRAQLAAVQQGYSFFCLPSSFFYLPSFVCLLLSFICLLLSAFFFSQSDSLLSFSQSVCLLFSTFCLPSFGHLASAFFWPSPFDHLLATLFWLPFLATFCLPLATFFGPSFLGRHLLAFFWLPSVRLHLAALAVCLLFTAFFWLPSLTTIWPSFGLILLPILFVCLLCLLLTCFHSCSFCFHPCCFLHLCSICSAAQRKIQCPLLHLALTALMSKSLVSFCILSDWLKHQKQCQQNKLECSHVWHRTRMFWHNSCPKS